LGNIYQEKSGNPGHKDILWAFTRPSVRQKNYSRCSTMRQIYFWWYDSSRRRRWKFATYIFQASNSGKYVNHYFFGSWQTNKEWRMYLDVPTYLSVHIYVHCTYVHIRYMYLMVLSFVVKFQYLKCHNVKKLLKMSYLT
jgi:hypothetical protein